MKLAIRFGDNDFYNTFIPLLQSINSAFHNSDNFPEDKTSLLRFVNELSFPFYLLAQNQLKYNASEEELKRMKKYLEISEEQLLLDKEIDEYLKEDIHYNGELYLLDTSNNYVWCL